MDKAKLFELVINAIKTEISDEEKSMANIRQESIDSPGAMQSHSDTNKFQAGHLADNLGALIESKRRAIDQIESLAKTAGAVDKKIGVGSFVEVEKQGSREHAWYFMLPSSGGTEISYDSKKIMVITSTAPIVKHLVGRAVGEVAEFPNPDNPDSPHKLKIIDLH